MPFLWLCLYILVYEFFITYRSDDAYLSLYALKGRRATKQQPAQMDFAL
jgi:hypothetical protein